MTRSLIWRYYLFRATNTAGFYLPVAVVLLLDKGFGLGFVGLAYAVFSVGMLAAEVPTGYLGDLLGRRWSLALGAGCRAATLAAYPFADSKAAFLALHLLWATGWAFRSGTVDAWLYEVLQARFDESRYTHIESRGSTVLLATSAGAAVLGATLYGLDARLPFLVNAAVAAAGIPVLFALPETDPTAGGDATSGDDATVDGPADDEAFSGLDALRVLRVQTRRPEIRWLVLYVALFSGLFSVTPIFEQPALQSVGVPVTGLGVLYAAFKLVSAGAASTAGWLRETLGTRGYFALLPAAYGVGYAAVALAPVVVIPLLFMNRGLRVVTRPIRNQYLNDRFDGVGRATVLSGVSMAVSLSGALAKLVGGPLAERMGLFGFLPAAGVVVAVAAAGVWLAVSPVREQEGDPVGVEGGVAPTD